MNIANKITLARVILIPVFCFFLMYDKLPGWSKWVAMGIFIVASLTDFVDENNTKQLYQYGYFVSRPIRFGTDEYKTITRLLHRYTHYAVGSNVKLALYGSRDGVRYGGINTLRGMSYQYFIFVIFTYLKPNERYSYVSVDFETRLTNKLR